MGAGASADAESDHEMVAAEAMLSLGLASDHCIHDLDHNIA
jgi:hypothetical protein